jgi:signal peptidase I
MNYTHETVLNGEIKKKKSAVREYAEAIILAVILALFVRAFVIQAFKIPSGSMIPTLLVGDHILVNKFAYGIKIPFTDKMVFRFWDPQRQDVIVFIYPLDTSKDFIKRVIGLPGETLQVINKKIYINGSAIEDPHAHYSTSEILPGNVYQRDNFGPVTIPADSYFVMGDNRDKSLDSRFWGVVTREAIKGKAFIIYWSWDFSPFVFRWNRIGKIVH